MTSRLVHLETNGPVATIRVQRPEVRNALSVAAWHELAGQLDEAASRFPAVRVVLIRGAGDKAFVAGADIQELKGIVQEDGGGRAYVELVESVMKRLERLPQPVVAVVNGDAVGAGVELMAACDLRIAVEGARLGIPATKLGLAITGQDLLRLERLIGVGRVKWLMLTGRLVEAMVAMSWGLVDAVFPSNALEAAAASLAVELASNSALSSFLTKTALRTYLDSVAQGDEAGFECSLTAWKSRSLVEGITAFIQRRRPDFASVDSADLAEATRPRGESG